MGCGILRKQTNWERLHYYQKTVALYQLTSSFCHRFLPQHGDRTVDQMTQAARSGKQNIVEGFAAGVTSTETELKLLNVARASIKELQEDFADYLKARGLAMWQTGHPRFAALLEFCRTHNKAEDYEPVIAKAGAEESANLAITLCRMVDRMISTHLRAKEERFTEEGGIRERMTAARLGRRQTQNETIAALQRENEALRREIEELKRLVKGQGY